MPSIAQQDYIIIAPKEGRAFAEDAAAMGQLKKAVLNGTVFDCLLKDLTVSENTLDRVLGIYLDSEVILASDIEGGGVRNIETYYTPDQYSGLAAVQEAIDIEIGEISDELPQLHQEENLLIEAVQSIYICVDGKYLVVTGSSTITALALSDEGPAEGEDFINITWEDAQKLIGLPIA